MVKIVEFFDQPIDDTLPFNVVEDVSIYMRNNPMFYRKHFYPTMLHFKDLMQAKKKVDPVGLFNPMIEKAAYNYCKEYNIRKRPEELLTDEERKDLIRKIYEEELKNIREGVYE